MNKSKENGRQPAPETEQTFQAEAATLAAGVLGSAEENQPMRFESDDSEHTLYTVFYGPSEYRL